jgi:hypothetical protein
MSVRISEQLCELGYEVLPDSHMPKSTTVCTLHHMRFSLILVESKKTLEITWNISNTEVVERQQQQQQ